MKYLITIFTLVCSLHIAEGQQLDVTDQAYINNFREWQEELNNGRMGYLKLTALCRLNEGETMVGCSEEDDCRISAIRSSERLGKFELLDNTIHFYPGSDRNIEFDGERIDTKVMVGIGSSGDSELFISENLTWKIITRGGRYFIRSYDSDNPAVEEFRGFERYPLSSDYIFNASFRYFDAPETSAVDSRIGLPEQWSFIGRLTFSFGGREYSLDVSENGFTMVRDLTSGEETYGGGRYMYLDLPDEDGMVVLDLNKLYNPPCAFSEFTTCLLPPVQNTLDFELKAGERSEPLQQN